MTVPSLPVPASTISHGLVVEDLPEIATWLTSMLQACFAGIVVEHASRLVAAAAAIRTARFDIALVDLGLPDGSGLDLIRVLAAEQPACHIVVSTMFADDEHLFPALRAGAHGYLLKDHPREQTLAALRGIAAGQPPLSAAIARRLLRAFGERGETAAGSSEGEDLRRLSPREREALTLLAKGYKMERVAEAMNVSPNTAHGFTKNVYRKLNISSRAEAALEATRLGLVKPA